MVEGKERRKICRILQEKWPKRQKEQGSRTLLYEWHKNIPPRGHDRKRDYKVSKANFLNDLNSISRKPTEGIGCSLQSCQTVSVSHMLESQARYKDSSYSEIQFPWRMMISTVFVQYKNSDESVVEKLSVVISCCFSALTSTPESVLSQLLQQRAITINRLFQKIILNSKLVSRGVRNSLNWGRGIEAEL